MKFAKFGSGLYIVWGLLHVAAAFQEFALRAGLEPGLIRGKLNQGAWELLFIALAAILVAIFLNWKNSRMGYWINLLMVSIADIGFLIFVSFPGYVTVMPSILGPIFWVAAAIFSTIGIRTKATN